MRFSSWVAATTALATAATAVPTSQVAPRDDLEAAKVEVTQRISELIQKKMDSLKARESVVEHKQEASKGPCKSTCTAANVAIRRE
jgi:hypothetical protein